MSLLPSVIWPDAVAITRNWLHAHNLGAPVEVKMPIPRPTTIVIVERGGGPRNQAWDNPRLAFQCWAETQDDALDLVNNVRDALAQMPGLRDGFHVSHTDESGGPAWAPDTNTASPCFLLTVDARIRANSKP